MKLVIEIGENEDDSPEFLLIVERVVHGLVNQNSPKEVWLIRVKNWFSKDWSSTSRETPNDGRKKKSHRLVLPAIDPSRIEAIQYLHSVVGGYRNTETPVEIYTESENELETLCFLDEISNNALFVWYSGSTGKNRRGSLMVSQIHKIENRGWHAEFRLQSRSWTTSSLTGISNEELAEITGWSPNRFTKHRKSPDWPKTTSVELRGIIDAFRSRSKSLGYALRSSGWSCEHFVEGVEHLVFEFRPDTQSYIELVFWSDGLMWVGTRFWGFYGRWTKVKPDQLVEMYKESTLHLGYGFDDEQAFRAAWAQVEPTNDPDLHLDPQR